MSDLRGIAKEAVMIAQREILKVVSGDFNVEWKEDQTPVTIADKNSEEAVREFLMKETPEFAIIGEEFSTHNEESEYSWIIDPIDGTKSFIAGVPLYGTLLALYKKNEPLLGIINLPALQQCMVGQKGAGVTINDTKIKPIQPVPLAESTVLSGTINSIETLGYSESFYNLRHAARLYRGWGDCYGYFLAAAGKAHVMFDPVVSVWDIAPMHSIFSEVGGSFTTLSGDSISLFDENGRISQKTDMYSGLATNGVNHSEILSFL